MNDLHTVNAIGTLLEELGHEEALRRLRGAASPPETGSRTRVAGSKPGDPQDTTSELPFADQAEPWLGEAISDLEDRLAGITIHSCHSQCQRPACVARRERDEARQLAKEARDLLESEGYAVNPLPWESPKNGAAHASEEGPTNQELKP